MNPLLEVKSLCIDFKTQDGTVHALNGVDLYLNEGETLGLVGETGAGKTTLAKGIMRLIQTPPGRYVSGEILYEGKDMLKMGDSELRSIRGKCISMVFQDQMTALNPVMCVGDQIAEAVAIHERVNKKGAKERACEMLECVGILPERYGDYPHQFSGGMKQRVVIALALACNPKVLLADEPTTALDVTIQAQMFELMRDLRKKFNTATLLITHDLGLVAQNCERVAVIYAGEIVEYGALMDIFEHMQHPYTIGLFRAIPRLDMAVHRLSPIDGLMPDPTLEQPGCRFADRCPHATERCRNEKPQMHVVAEGHGVRCFMAEDKEVHANGN